MRVGALLARRRIAADDLVQTAPGPSLVTLRAEGEPPPFGDPRLASEIFAITVRHPATLAACLLPDRLLWLLRPGWDVGETVGRFKAYSNRLAHRTGVDQRLWAHAYERSPVVGRGAEVSRLLVQEPQRSGLVASSAEYPWKIRRG